MIDFLELTRARNLKATGETDVNNLLQQDWHVGAGGDDYFDRIIMERAQQFEARMKQYYPDEAEGFVMGLYYIDKQVRAGNGLGNVFLNQYILNFPSSGSFIGYFKNRRETLGSHV